MSVDAFYEGKEVCPVKLQAEKTCAALCDAPLQQYKSCVGRHDGARARAVLRCADASQPRLAPATARRSTTTSGTASTSACALSPRVSVVVALTRAQAAPKLFAKLK